MPDQLADISAHHAEVDVNVPCSDTDGWCAQLEEPVERDTTSSVFVEDAVAIRKDGPLCFKRVDLPVGRSILELGLGHSQLASKATKLKRSCQSAWHR